MACSADKIQQLKAEYETEGSTVSGVAKHHSLNRGTVIRLAKKHGWVKYEKSSSAGGIKPKSNQKATLFKKDEKQQPGKFVVTKEPQAIEKSNVGRPRLFNSVKELQEQIDAYFLRCDDTEHPRPYTVSGLAVFLKCDIGTIRNYSLKDEFFTTIRSAKAKIENYAEESLFLSPRTAGIIFSLKNNFTDWKDKTVVEQTSRVLKRVIMTVDKASGDDEFAEAVKQEIKHE